MREFKLDSGAILKLQPAPFKDSKALYQALLRELKGVTLSASVDMASVYRDLFCLGFASPDIEACIWKCMERCLLNDLRIDDNTFEPVERRDDYVKVCVEIARENVFPFFKSLYAEYLKNELTTASTPK